MVISLPPISDYHIHLREGKMLSDIAKYTKRCCGRVLVMPNTKEPILTAADAIRYRRQIEKYLGKVEVLTTIKLTPRTTIDMVREAHDAGVVAAKVYPECVTTNSDDGWPAAVFDINVDGTTTGTLVHPRKSRHFLDLAEEIQKLGMVLSFHAEMPNCEVLKRETKFLDFINFVIRAFPGLRVVLEHITTQESVSAVRAWQYLDIGKPCRVAATITAHHLYLTIDNVISDKIQPWNFCSPVPKQETDRSALRHAAFSGERCFFFGSDSAPHRKSNKECHEGCAGVFSAPVVVESLVELFDDYGSLDRLPNFIAHFGDQFYKLPSVQMDDKKYQRKDWKVPEEIAGVRPFLAGEVLKWRITK